MLDIQEALWGTLGDLPDDTDDSQKDKRRRELVNNVRILLAAVGIDYKVAKMMKGTIVEGCGCWRDCPTDGLREEYAALVGRQEKAEMWRDDDDDEDDEDYDSDEL